MVQVRRLALMLGLALAVFANQNIWVTFSPVVTNASSILGVSVTLVGFLAITYPIFFLLLTVPSGILLDKNFKLWLGLGAALTFVGGVGRLANTSSYTWLLVCQLFGALAQPFLLNGFVPFATRVYEARRAFVISMLSLSMYLGTIFALASGVALYNAGGVLYMAIPPAAISGVGLLLFVGGIQAVEAKPVEVKMLNLRSVVRRRDLWIIGVILGLGVAAFDNLSTWLEPALQPVGLESVAGDAVAVAIIVGLVGVVLIPSRISARNLRTRYLRLVIPIVTILFALLAFVATRITLFVFLGIGGFIMLPAYPIIMDWIGKFHEKDVQGSATGLVGLVSRVISVSLTLAAAWFIFSTTVYFAFLTVALFMAFVFSMVLPKDDKMPARQDVSER
jgi:major facilitator 4 family protein